MKRILLASLLCLSIISCQHDKTKNEKNDQSTSREGILLEVNLDEQIAPIQPTMWGLFFEDINFAADGGLNAELIKNYSFEFLNPIMGWHRIQEDGAKGYFYTKSNNSTTNKKYLEVQRLNTEGELGIQNDGFRGIGIKESETYDVSFIARKKEGEYLKLRVQILDSKWNIVGESEIAGFSDSWEKHELSIQSKVTDAHGHFRIFIEGKGILDLDLISMYPADTWQNKKKGLRKDLVQLLADMKPGFLRFPGGCIVEGFELGNRYEWKKTVGEMDERPVKINRWNFEFAHRSTPDYYQSFALGFFEYFQLSEDIGAEPLPILSCGIACQFNSGEIVPMDLLDPYIQDALDLIEFANGSTNSTWGALRSKMGHPESFKLKYIGIGNEQWGPQYIERAKAFNKVLADKYSEITIVSTSGPFPDGEEFEYLWDELKKMNAKLIDEHYYRPPNWFFENARRYDDYDRNGPKIFAGEFAAHTKSTGARGRKNNWHSALAEAAFMTGLERNADLVYLASYAPLFAHVDAWQWSPDLIWFDNLRSMGTPNYYVQKLYSTNKGTDLITITNQGISLAGEDSLYASATIDKNTNEAIIKIVNSSRDSQNVKFEFNGGEIAKGKVLITTLASEDLDVENTLDDPENIAPVEHSLELTDSNTEIKLDGNSLNIIRFKLK